MVLNEDRLDTQRLYFHGSMSLRKTSLDTSSFRYPFYITSDLNYAMAFANKKQSSCGGNRHLTFGDTGYVYPISINPNAEFFDFRTIESDMSVKQTIKSIIGDSVFDVAYDNWKGMFVGEKGKKLTDVWEFGSSLASLIYEDSIAPKDEKDGLPRIYDRSNAEEMRTARQLSQWYQIVEEGESHEILQVIFEGLSRLGYAGVITTETDIDPSDWSDVHTNYAVGIWDLDRFGLMCGAALKYRFCKKIVQLDSGAVKQKIEDFLRKYKAIAEKGGMHAS